jgi:gamma-glutamylcyclotransferase (GGCT)/AIG2-like uncharacterized protein YtfP
MSNFIYVYGTLRPGNSPVIWVPGKLYDLGFCPAARLELDRPEDSPDVSHIACEKISVTNNELMRLDTYEGYIEGRDDESLYRRVKFRDGWIYEYTTEPNESRRIHCGDWLVFRNLNKGVNSHRFELKPVKTTDYTEEDLAAPSNPCPAFVEEGY